MESTREILRSSRNDQGSGNSLLATVRYTPLLAGLLALGLLAAYALSRTGLLGKPAWQLLGAAIMTGAVGLVLLPIVSLARRGRELLAYSLFSLTIAAWGIALVWLWQFVAPVAILLVWSALPAGMAARMQRKYLVASAVFNAACTAAMLWINANPQVQRLSSSDPAGLTAITLVASTVVLFLLGMVAVRLIEFRSLQSRLVISFVLIITVPILFTAAISAITAYNDSQNQFGDALKAVSSLKQDQVDSGVRSIAVAMSTIQQGSGRASSILRALDRGNQTDETYALNTSVGTSLLRDLLVSYPASHLEQALILNPEGEVVLSTYEQDEGTSLADASFFRGGSREFYAEMSRFPSKQNAPAEYKLVAAAPFYGAAPTDIRGVIVVVAKKDVILNIMGPTVGLSNAQTYLVRGDDKVVTDATTTEPLAIALPIQRLLSTKVGETTDVYINHEGRTVLGYLVWDRTLNTAIIAEIPQSAVVNKSLAALFVSGLVGLFTIVVAVIAVLSTSLAISDPIRALATTARSLSSGDLTARGKTDQRDEIGNLAASFNSMADQLQGMIGNLEQRIAERTEALEHQSLRLRTAAEVARDAASASGLDELLERAARLIQDRFGLYHTGIFLLDEKKEYAVLQATTSEPGIQMLANKHRLRVGEQGIVGRVAATGEPRIALDTGVDPVYFNNPFLPKTHSEMALPLKTSDEIIGIIDIQSEQPEAFTQDDIAIVQVMADQLATAIHRTRLLQQVQSQLSQLEQNQQDFTAESWRIFDRAGRKNIGYKFDNIRMESVKTLPEESRKVFEKSEGLQTPQASISPDTTAGQTLAVPIRLRGQTIGVVNLRFQSGRAPQATLDMVQQIADRLATALENARLLEDSTRRANKERAIGEITAKISSSVNMRNVLQTAVEELGRAIPGSDVLIQFQPETEN